MSNCFSFSKKNRQLTTKEIIFLRESGARRRVGSIVCFWKEKEEIGKSRISITVRKKNIKKAVLRNRIRRLVKESFRHSEIKNIGLDINILYSPLDKKLSPQPQQEELKKNIEKFFSLCVYAKKNETACS